MSVFDDLTGRLERWEALDKVARPLTAAIPTAAAGSSSGPGLERPYPRGRRPTPPSTRTLSSVHI